MTISGKRYEVDHTDGICRPAVATAGPPSQANQSCCNWDDTNATTLNAAGQLDDRTGFNWRYQILPYIEQTTLFQLPSRSTLYVTLVNSAVVEGPGSGNHGSGENSPAALGVGSWI